MLAGVQLSDGLKLEAIADGGFSYAEIPYEIIEKNELPTYKKKDGDSRVLKVSGFSYPLAKLTRIRCMSFWKIAGDIREII